jgi:hypothetical protein
MARIRTIKPEFWHDEKMAPCDPLTRLVFLGLISAADDFGRVLDNDRVLDAFMFPETSDSVREPLANLSRMGRVQRGRTASGQRIIQIVNWERHQKVDKPQPKMAFPEIVEIVEVAPIRESFANQSRTARESLAPHTTDPDLHTTDPDHSPPRKRSGPKPAAEKAFPYFGQEDRARAIAAFRKLGDFNAGRVINAVGFAYRPATDPEHIPHEYVSLGVEDYCGLITKGRSAPFATPENCAKILLGLARNCHRYETGGDPLARVDSNMLAIHGHKMAGAA